MPDDIVPDSPAEKFWRLAFSWPTMAVVAAILLSFGGGIMTSPHPFIADGFCIAGILVLIVKFWTWEGSKHDTTRKTALLLTGGTLFLIGIAVGLCFLSSYLNRSVPVSNEAAVPEVHPPQSVETPVIAPPPRSTPQISKPPATRIPNAQASVIPPKPTREQPTSGPQPTYQQQCKDCAQAQGPGAQATLIQQGPPRYMATITPAEQKKLTELLSSLKGKSIGFFVSTSTEDSEYFGKALLASARDAGIAFDSGTPVFVNVPIFGAKRNGMSISYPDDRSEEAESLVLSLHSSGFYTGPIPRVPSPGEAGLIGLYIEPQ